MPVRAYMISHKPKSTIRWDVVFVRYLYRFTRN